MRTNWRAGWRLAIPALAAASVLAASVAGAKPYLRAPALNEYSKHDPAGVTVLPNGRLLKPAGQVAPLASWPHGLQVSPDGARLFVPCASDGQVVSDLATGKPAVASLFQEPGVKRRGSLGGADISPDGGVLYWSSGDSGEVLVFEFPGGKQLASIPLNVPMGGVKFADSVAMDVKVSPDGRYVYCADVANFRVVVIDAAARKVVGSVRVGRYPYALAVSAKRVYVANIGMFEYSPIPAPDHPEPTIGKPPYAVGAARDPRGISFPAFGFPSRESRDGVQFEGRRVPGLGDPNVPESFSVWGIDVADPARPTVVSRIKTGLLVGAPGDIGKTVGGSAPNYLVLRGSTLFVSNNNNDMIQRFDLRTGKVAAQARIIPSPLTRKLRGVCPCGMSLSPDGRRLYVAEMGINAIAVLDAATLAVQGHIPTAWYPYRVEVSRDGRTLYVANFRGFGNGPRSPVLPVNNPFLGMVGVLSVVPVPDAPRLKAMTATVMQCNGLVDRSAERARLTSPVIPVEVGKRSEQIKYVVFITKENHTYDTIFDHIPGANDDPKLLRWGLHQTIRGDGQPTLENVGVMVNHNALARQFTVSDNFHMEPEASGVGHRWLVGVQPNNWCQMTYTLGWKFDENSTAPGRRASFGSNGSIAPEDYPEAGSMWEHLARGGVRFRNYGEGFEFAGVGEDPGEHPTGAREVVNIPMSKVLYDNTSREFPIFNMDIPDQYRAHWFEREFRRLYITGKAAPPSFINIAICNDHGTGPNPARGYPYVASWMADNDMALGRIVDFLSHTKYWKNMAIFVTQDDSGGEPDHIDAQRSVLLAISPWIKHGYVSHRHTTIVSMHRTLYQVFGLAPLNMFDALANDFSDCFTTRPDFRPYNVVPVDRRIFDAEKAKDPADPEYTRARGARTVAMDAEDEEERVLSIGSRESTPFRRR